MITNSTNTTLDIILQICYLTNFVNYKSPPMFPVTRIHPTLCFGSSKRDRTCCYKHKQAQLSFRFGRGNIYVGRACSCCDFYLIVFIYCNSASVVLFWCLSSTSLQVTLPPTRWINYKRPIFVDYLKMVVVVVYFYRNPDRPNKFRGWRWLFWVDIVQTELRKVSQCKYVLD